MAEQNGNKLATLIRLPSELKQKYLVRAAQESVQSGKPVSLNKLIVQDLECLDRQREKDGGRNG